MKGLLEDSAKIVLVSRDELHHTGFFGVMPRIAGGRSPGGKPPLCPLKGNPAFLQNFCEIRLSFH